MRRNAPRLRSGHIDPDFADDGLGDADINAVYPGQVDAADALQFLAEINLRSMAFLVGEALQIRSSP